MFDMRSLALIIADVLSIVLMKVDILALGMLSAIRRTLEMVGNSCGQPLKMLRNR